MATPTRSTTLVPDEEVSPGRTSGTAIIPAPTGSAPAPASGEPDEAPPARTTTTTVVPEPKPVLPALREVVTASIGVAIVFVTLVIAWRLFSMSTTPPQWTRNTPPGIDPVAFDPFQRGKDILLILLPLAGAIVGYYTGRVIADRTIDQANQTAASATQTATQAQQAKQEVQADAEAIAEVALRRVSSSGLERRGGLEAAGSADKESEPERDRDLDEVKRRLARIRAR